MEITNRSHMHMTSISDPSDVTVTMIIPSGWRNYYHVITETPEEGDHYYSHEFMHLDKVALRYNIRPMAIRLMRIYGEEESNGREGSK